MFNNTQHQNHFGVSIKADKNWTGVVSNDSRNLHNRCFLLVYFICFLIFLTGSLSIRGYYGQFGYLFFLSDSLEPITSTLTTIPRPPSTLPPNMRNKLSNNVETKVNATRNRLTVTPILASSELETATATATATATPIETLSNSTLIMKWDNLEKLDHLGSNHLYPQQSNSDSQPNLDQSNNHNSYTLFIKRVSISLIIIATTGGLLVLSYFGLRRFPKTIVYGCIFSSTILLLSFTIVSFITKYNVIGICLLVVLIALCCWIYIIHQRIPLAVSFIHEAALVLGDNRELLLILVPIVTVVAFVVYLGLAYLTSTVAISISTIAPLNPVSLAAIITMIIFGLFFNFWTYETLRSIQTIVVAHYISQYYWRKKSSLDYFLHDSVVVIFTYHIGTALYSALILPIVETVRSITHYLTVCRNKSSYITNNTNYVTNKLRLFGCCFEWLFRQVESGWPLVGKINRFGNIYTAMYGYDFQSSCQNTLQLFMRHDCQNFINDIVARSVLQLLGMFILIISLSIGFLVNYFIYVFDSNGDTRVDIANYFSTSLIIIIIALVNVILTYYRLYLDIVDTLFVVYIEDIERSSQLNEPLSCTTEWRQALADCRFTPITLQVYNSFRLVDFDFL